MSLVITAVVVVSVPLELEAAGDARAAIQQEVEKLERGEILDVFGVSLHGSDVLAALYRRRDFRAAWAAPSKRDDIVRAIGHAGEQGLDPGDYSLGAIVAARMQTGDGAASNARIDLLLTSSLIKLAWDVRFGRVPTSAFDRHSLREKKLTADDPVDDLMRAVDSGRVAEFVESLEPQTPFYRLLQQALADYRRLDASGGWPLVPTGPTLKPGGIDPRVAVLRRRLVVTGELPADHSGVAWRPAADLYDDATVAGVKSFQATHGLDNDGVLGTQTVAALCVTAAARVDQIRATLERARWFLRDLPQRFLMVNAAGFRVGLFENGEVKWHSRAIVGKPETQTPMFRAEMRSVLLNPTWTVPRSIVANEFLPAMQGDPHFLAKRHICVIDGEYVQAAGPDNALGRIKLNLPNPYSVYLHDTPTRSLFGKAKRALSHGCVRVENPVQLAALALDDPQWTVETLDAAIASGKTRSVSLKKPLPVLVLYWSVTFDGDGRLEFLPDLYGRDADVLRGLDAVR